MPAASGPDAVAKVRRKADAPITGKHRTAATKGKRRNAESSTDGKRCKADAGCRELAAGAAASSAAASASPAAASASFSSLPLLATLRLALSESFPFEQLTPVQQATIPAALAGRDVIARARTGSGKTLAFLLPAIQRVAADPDQPGVRAVLVSPTRELATQTGAVCEALLSHMPRVSCRCAVGGTSVHGDVAALRGSLCPGILVGTPGRLNDLLSGGHGAASAFGRVACLVLDEADQLLALGFRRPVEAVVASLRRAAHPAAPPWQTLLFSATLRGDVRSLAAAARRGCAPPTAAEDDDLLVADAIGAEAPTNAAVEQAVTVSPPAALAAELVRTLLALRSHPAAKVIVYAGAARLVSFLAALCRRMGLGGSAPLELHARLPHAERASVDAAFRASEGGRLFLEALGALGVQ